MALLNRIFYVLSRFISYTLIDLPEISPERRREIAGKVGKYAEELIIEAVRAGAEGAAQGVAKELGDKVGDLCYIC